MLKITLGIDGMQCSMCEAHINDTIRRSPVKKVTSSHSKIRLSFSQRRISANRS